MHGRPKALVENIDCKLPGHNNERRFILGAHVCINHVRDRINHYIVGMIVRIISKCVDVCSPRSIVCQTVEYARGQRVQPLSYTTFSLIGCMKSMAKYGIPKEILEKALICPLKRSEDSH